VYNQFRLLDLPKAAQPESQKYENEAYKDFYIGDCFADAGCQTEASLRNTAVLASPAELFEAGTALAFAQLSVELHAAAGYAESLVQAPRGLEVSERCTLTSSSSFESDLCFPDPFRLSIPNLRFQSPAVEAALPILTVRPLIAPDLALECMKLHLHELLDGLQCTLAELADAAAAATEEGDFVVDAEAAEQYFRWVDLLWKSGSPWRRGDMLAQDLCDILRCPVADLCDGLPLGWFSELRRCRVLWWPSLCGDLLVAWADAATQ
jgi:hypothetical protein